MTTAPKWKLPEYVKSSNNEPNSYIWECKWKCTEWYIKCIFNINNVLFIAIYINNLLLFGPKGLVINNLKDLLKSEFKGTDLGDLH